jgi:cell division protein FtsB
MDLGPLVPIVAILSGLGWGYLGYKKRELAHRYDYAKRDAEEQRDEKDRLKQRVAVLEQIVTDRGAETANQIEALRAPRLTGDKIS